MTSKKYIYILSGILCCSLILLLVIFGIEKENKRIKEIANEEEKLKKVYTNKNKEIENDVDSKIAEELFGQSEEERVVKVSSYILNEFHSYINRKEYKKAYSMLDEKYREDFNYTLEEFKLEYSKRKIEKYLMGDLATYGIDRDISFNYYIITKQGFINKNLTIFRKDNNITLANEIITNISEMNTSVENENIELLIKRKYKVDGKVAYLVEIMNNKDESLIINNTKEGIYSLYEGRKIGHKLLNKNIEYYDMDYMINPDEKEEYLIKFQTENDIDNIWLENKDGKKIELNFLKNRI
ncbi:hypothetical protein [Senegalia massiliensis]|uniref:Uncharacterized protein n=1 Tax=Senegalia massiliensis TaxID=1720316 RepID=A0A845R058_9CLOT|nr:hypothetical protein [Senegalia massiliensis]NBI07594.1 hypothetical protein [Senegalia massiliensis]